MSAREAWSALQVGARIIRVLVSVECPQMDRCNAREIVDETNATAASSTHARLVQRIKPVTEGGCDCASCLGVHGASVAYAGRAAGSH